jgi:hypothetical protein
LVATFDKFALKHLSVIELFDSGTDETEVLAPDAFHSPAQFLVNEGACSVSLLTNHVASVDAIGHLLALDKVVTL